MNSERTTTFIMMPEADLLQIRYLLQEILTAINATAAKMSNCSIEPEYIPAAAFMKAVNIKRTKFYELITGNKIRTLKKRRKVYVLASEVSRYFNDPAFQ
ncbi:hypothetical protein [Chitinophaga defluvii]|uniref:Helix-turn-helix protein n=1 Tax=Chitinophaga defluvii TaxID=3163343 RepID=A0ABV2T9P4_9BACT